MRWPQDRSAWPPGRSESTLRGFGEADVASAAGHGVAKCLCHMGFPDADSEGDRLQQLRAVLPCEVRVVAPSASIVRVSFGGGGHLSAGTVCYCSWLICRMARRARSRADATDALGDCGAGGRCVGAECGRAA